MKIKSLLIGSAAALVAATGAKAADAVVVAEPEPVEYVRVCDAYGAGFFYIPGTETCLSISGYVWFQVQTSETLAVTDSVPYYGPGGAWGVNDRARVNFDARSDTEWGTLRGFIRLQGTFNAYGATTLNQRGTVDGAALIDQAFIELGGFRMGYSESAFNQTQGGGNTNWGSHSWGGMYYNYQQRNLLAYTFQGGNGFFGTISLEDDANANYAPDVVVKIGVNQGWGAVWAMVGYDEDIGFNTALAGADGWGAALGLHLNVPNMPGSSLRVIYFYADSSNAYGAPGPGCVACVAPIVYEHSILASYNHAFSSTLSASVAFQYFADAYFPATAIQFTNDAWAAELSIVWFPVENFEVRTELHYDDMGGGTGLGFNPGGVVSGFLRFTRYF